VRAIAQLYCAQFETVALGKTGQQEMQAREAIAGDQHHPALEILARQRHDQRGQRRGHVLGRCQ
jgi:hypothetical protein